jgi:hypothetical protein
MVKRDIMKIYRLVAFLSAFVLLLSSVAFGDAIFEDQVYDNEVFVIDGVNHTAKYYPSNGKVSVRAGEDVLIMSVGDCQDIDILEYCIDGANTTEIDDEKGYRVVGYIDISVTKQAPSISASSGLSASIIGVGEPVTLKVELENDGLERASDVSFKVKVPSHVAFSAISAGMVNLGSQAVWSGAILPDEIKALSLTLKADEYNDFNISFEGYLVFKGENIPISLGNIHVKVITPVEFESSISTESVILNEESVFTVLLTNNDATAPLELSELKIDVPKGLDVGEKTQSLRQSGDSFITSGSIGAGKSESFFVKVKTMERGEYNISASFEGVIHEKVFDARSSGLLRVGLADISPQVIMTPSSAVAGDPVDVLVTIKNSGSRDISSFDLDINSNIIPALHLVNQSIGAKESRTIYSKEIEVPEVEKETQYFVKVSGAHKNLAGSLLNFDAQKSISVSPKAQLVDFIQDVSFDGKSVKVSLKIKSLKEDLTDIDVVDSVPKGISTTGSLDGHIDMLKKGEEKDLFSYSIILPLTYKEKTVAVQRVFNARQADSDLYKLEKEIILNVDSEDITDSVNDSAEFGLYQSNVSSSAPLADNGSATSSAAQVSGPEKKEGFFSRIISGVKSFFSGLFG